MSDSLLLHAQGLNQNLAALTAVMRDRFALSAAAGAITLAAASSTTVTNSLAKTASYILLFPTNAAAANLQAGAHALYVSSRLNGSFIVSTADAGSAVGTETFDYLIINTG
jgi:hypothetical protein